MREAGLDFLEREPSLAGVAFQACSFNHSDISPCRVNDVQRRSIGLTSAVLGDLSFDVENGWLRGLATSGTCSCGAGRA